MNIALEFKVPSAADELINIASCLYIPTGGRVRYDVYCIHCWKAAKSLFDCFLHELTLSKQGLKVLISF